MSFFLGRTAVLVKRVWLDLEARLGRRRSGLGELTREVRTCEYDDVHVMWELLSGMDGSAPRQYVHVPASGAMIAAAAGKKRRRRRRMADAESAAWSRLFSSCCAF
ncbi:uncharacterized protein LOC124670657 [Lolium rigidum]|uniref:uncharacterized protein LOC124670657 n=1 Tax=Lolium rigidum TaxID=89674 RepID=UPI001F5DB5E3|nr:uncharacterized protein LOC124670657 [Lolium rigidum]